MLRHFHVRHFQRPRLRHDELYVIATFALLSTVALRPLRQLLSYVRRTLRCVRSVRCVEWKLRFGHCKLL